MEKEKKNELSQNKYISSCRDLRYILTQDCNYNCGFCHKERMNGNEKPLFDSKDYSFIYETANQAIPLQGVTFTGGEPLIRKDIYDVFTKLKDKNAFITMVTNGSLLNKRSEILSLLDRLNISLHTTNQALYENITNSRTNIKNLMHDISGIKKQYPHIDLRINATLVKDSTATPTEINNMLKFVKVNDLTIKYLELSPRSSEGFVSDKFLIPFLDKQGFTETTTKNGEIIYVSGNAKVILRKLICSVVQDNNLDQDYCKNNADINISPDGRISPCLLDQKKIGIYEFVKSRDKESLANTFIDATNDSTRYKCCIKK